MTLNHAIIQGAGASAAAGVDLATVESLDEEFSKHSDDEVFGAIQATTDAATSRGELLLQLKELKRLIKTISPAKSRDKQR